MDIRITPKKLYGEVIAPPSKSSAHRLLICAALADSGSFVCYGGAASDDIKATERCLRGLGAKINVGPDGAAVIPIDKACGNADAAADEIMDCGESGSTLRFLVPVAAALGGTRKFLLRGKLPDRPLSPLKEELCRHGAKIRLDGNILTVCGDGMTGGEFTIDGSVSSQFISGLLFAMAILPDDSRVRVTGRTESRPYIDMTVAALYNYGIKIAENNGVFSVSERTGEVPSKVRAEGDWSGAAFWVFAGAMSDRGILCRGLDPESLQGDRRCVDIVRSMGAFTEYGNGGVFVRREHSLRGLNLNAADIPDLVPVCAAASAAASGVTEITGASRLRLKESDRIKSTCRMINALGGKAFGHGDGITVEGCASLHTADDVDSENDHRIAMSAAVLSCAADSPVTVRGAECVAKSYPGFWDDFAALGGIAEIL